MADPPPFILTLQLDQPVFDFFNALRKKHFPPAINYLDAHLTLFHHLPPVAAVTDWVETVAAQQWIMTLPVTGVMKLGRGVAFRIQSQELMQLHNSLKQPWQAWLTSQDRQGFRPHITVQNKVDTATANALFDELTTTFQPFVAQGMGLRLWEYRGGPWHIVNDFAFRPPLLA